MKTISTTRRVLAVVAVTTALCADHVAVASPLTRCERVEIGQIASRLVNRLAQNFRRTMPAILREPDRQARVIPVENVRLSADRSVSIQHAPGSPFQFRLPPPVC